MNSIKADMLEAIKMCIIAWDNVKLFNICSCFQHCNNRTRSISTSINNADMIDEPALSQELYDQLALFPFSNLTHISFLRSHPSERETYILPLMMKSYKKFIVKSWRNLHPRRWISARAQKVSPWEAHKLLVLVVLVVLTLL